jgi:protein-tyrosine-phosphatase/DNA-binding transcriptional ArsR family regulator
MYREVVTPPAFVRLAAHPLRWRLLTVLAGGDHRVRELVALIGEPQSLVSYHLRLLRDGGLVSATRSSFDGRDSYYHLDLDRCSTALAAAGAALHPALTTPALATPALAIPAPATPALHTAGRPRPGVLFVCTGNSARSPIAEALLHRHSGGRLEVASAGGAPKSDLHPDAVRVLRDRGIDVSGRRPRHWDTVTGRRFDYVISLCDRAREALPGFAGDPRRMHWSLADPAAGGMPAFEHTAREIETRIRHLLPVLTATTST